MKTDYTPEPTQSKFKLSDFFNAHWPDYVKAPKKHITEDQFRAVNALSACRTPVLGVKTFACHDCGDISQQYHSCKHRFCPTCSWKETIKWADKAHEKLLEIPHRHAVATLPHSLNGLLQRNYRQLSQALFWASAQTIKEWMNARHAIKPGIMSVQHTFGELKNWHQHIHMIVTWGGLCTKTEAIKPLKSEHIPYAFLRKKFRILFENRLVELYDKGELKHDFSNRSEMLTFLKQTNKSSWTFHFEPPMPVAQQVVRYIGRYSKRFCLSERKITNIENDSISFRYKDYKELDDQGKAVEKVCQLSARDFFARLLQHVPPKGFQVVRYYGLYAHSYKLGAEVKIKKPITEAPTAYKKADFCEHCNKQKALLSIYFDNRPAKERRLEKQNNHAPELKHSG